MGKYRKYNIFFDFRFMDNAIFPSVAENQENMIFTFSLFTKMRFFMQRYSSNIQGIFLYSIFLKHYLGVFSKI